MKMENPNKQEILNPKKIFLYYLHERVWWKIPWGRGGHPN
jgi:hypothetical protein